MASIDKMDSVERTSVTPSKSRIARTFAKVLHARAATGITPVEEYRKIKTQEKITEDRTHEKINPYTAKVEKRKSINKRDEEERKNRVALEALLAKMFANVSSIKAAYAQLQLAQSPYDAESIQSSDRMVVSELKSLSELKQCYFKKEFDPFPEKALISAEIEEQKTHLKTYQITAKKMESQMKLKESEITFLKEKLEECKKENKVLEKRLNSSGQLRVLDNLHLSGLNPNHFLPVLKHTVRSIRNFASVMISEMRSAGWDLDLAASVIHPGIKYWIPDHKCFSFESFVSRVMFENFCFPNFSLLNESTPDPKSRQRLFFERFKKLQYMKAKEYLIQNPKSTFGRFCRAKYLSLVHPKMDSSLFGTLTRNPVNSGEYPETNFFSTFIEMARRVWLLHCLAFSFDPPASIFQVKRGTRYSEVFMESVSDEAFSPEMVPAVGFTVVPGFKIGKSVIQCEVYLCEAELT